MEKYFVHKKAGLLILFLAYTLKTCPLLCLAKNIPHSLIEPSKKLQRNVDQLKEVPDELHFSE